MVRALGGRSEHNHIPRFKGTVIYNVCRVGFEDFPDDMKAYVLPVYAGIGPEPRKRGWRLPVIEFIQYAYDQAYTVARLLFGPLAVSVGSPFPRLSDLLDSVLQSKAKRVPFQALRGVPSLCHA